MSKVYPITSLSNLLDTVNGVLYIADLSYPREDKDCSEYTEEYIVDGMAFHGYMTCPMEAEEYDGLVKDGIDPVEWAIGNYPAPGTCAPNRMGFVPWYEAERLNRTQFMVT